MSKQEPFQLTVAANGVHYFRYQGWQKKHSDGRISDVSVGFSSRLEASTPTTYNGLNYALHIVDDRHQVIHHRQKLAEALAIPLEAWTCAEQVHGCQTLAVNSDHRGQGLYDAEDAMAQTDGLLTNDENVWLVSFYADCVPLFFWDPDHSVMAIAHAGWRGTALEIARQTIEHMQHRYQSDASRIQCLIGPAIGPCCYEVDRHVAEQLAQTINAHEDLSEMIRPIENRSEKYLIDLKRCNQIIMMKAGILSTHIEISQWCTSCHPELFFSHRKEHGNTGRMAAWMYMGQSI